MLRVAPSGRVRRKVKVGYGAKGHGGLCRLGLRFALALLAQWIKPARQHLPPLPRLLPRISEANVRLGAEAKPHRLGAATVAKLPAPAASGADLEIKPGSAAIRIPARLVDPPERKRIQSCHVAFPFPLGLHLGLHLKRECWRMQAGGDETFCHGGGLEQPSFAKENER